MKRIASILLSLVMLITAVSGVTVEAYAAAKPKATSISSVRAKSCAFTVKWKKVKSVSGYQVQYSTNKKFKKNNKTVKVSKASKTSKTISKLKAKKKYYVRVRTYKRGKKKTAYSSWSKSKSVATTKPKVKPQTTEKQTTTKKPTSQQTTTHSHNWQPVYKTRKICVKEAYEEPVTATVPKTEATYHCTCGAWFNSTNCEGNPKKNLTLHVINNGGPNKEHETVGYFTQEPIPGEYETITTGSISHPAEYKEEKYIASYKCSDCGKTKSA